MKKRKNLTYTQRLQIETLNNAGKSKKEIAEQLNLNLCTIYRELKRGAYECIEKKDTFWKGVKTKKVVKYSALISQERYDLLCTAKGRPLKIGNDYSFVEYMEKRVVEDKISPCAVLGEIKRNNIPFNTNISKTTLYRYISMGLFPHIKLGKRKQQYKKTYIKKAPKGTSIEQRPKEVSNRNTFGHWEMDCVCCSNKYVFLVLSERLTRKEIIFKMKNQKSASVVECLDILEKKYGQYFYDIFKTITVDNGSEFSDFSGMEKSCFGEKKRIEVYYCHPYCACERGTNERLNREIRRLVPKGTDLSQYSLSEVQEIENWVNNYPREIFGFATSSELFDNQLKALGL